ncbi:hypothetical protein [Saccharicrinis sp. 156]
MTTNQKKIISTQNDIEVFFNALTNPPTPNDNFVMAAEAYKNYINK